MSDLLERDARVCWHPYTQHGVEEALLPVVAAKGSVLRLEDGRELVDAISSWWAVLHGHGHPELLTTLSEQAAELDHVLFAGATHHPAVGLAEELAEVTPPGLTRVFYSDDGSTAVEVALKMAYQQWVHRGEPDRRTFVAFDGAYHGDTFGAMSVGDPDPFFLPFGPLLFDVHRVPLEVEAVAATLDQGLGTIAAVIVEPLVQGAAGMRMQDPSFLRGLRELCDQHSLPLIADEVMTGFGRTGHLFACEAAGVSPDLLCLSKGLTGGTFPLAATVATEPMFEAFLSTDRMRTFFHGHTFTAHPVGCALARTSLRLCQEEKTPARLTTIGSRIEAHVRAELGEHPRIRELRQCGGIVAFDLAVEDPGYLAEMGPRIRRAAVERGVLLRPLGNVLYAMPPSSTDQDQCDAIAEVMVEVAREVTL